MMVAPVLGKSGQTECSSAKIWGLPTSLAIQQGGQRWRLRERSSRTMVSRIRFRSFKDLRPTKRTLGAILLIAGVWVVMRMNRVHDAFIFVDETHALSPLHMPVKVGEVPETFPSGE